MRPPHIHTAVAQDRDSIYKPRLTMPYQNILARGNVVSWQEAWGGPRNWIDNLGHWQRYTYVGYGHEVGEIVCGDWVWVPYVAPRPFPIQQPKRLREIFPDEWGVRVPVWQYSRNQQKTHENHLKQLKIIRNHYKTIYLFIYLYTYVCSQFLWPPRQPCWAKLASSASSNHLASMLRKCMGGVPMQDSSHVGLQ